MAEAEEAGVEGSARAMEAAGMAAAEGPASKARPGPEGTGAAVVEGVDEEAALEMGMVAVAMVGTAGQA